MPLLTVLPIRYHVWDTNKQNLETSLLQTNTTILEGWLVERCGPNKVKLSKFRLFSKGVSLKYEAEKCNQNN